MKDARGRIHAQDKIAATRYDLDVWMKCFPGESQSKSLKVHGCDTGEEILRIGCSTTELPRPLMFAICARSSSLAGKGIHNPGETDANCQEKEERPQDVA